MYYRIVFIFLLGFVSNKIYAHYDKSWVDIPRAYVALSASPKNKNIIDLIEQYHNIEKTTPGLLNQRINLLEKIHEAIINVAHADIDTINDKLKRLDLLVTKKAWYLNKIKDLYSNGARYDNHFVLSTTKKVYKPLPLVNKVLFDLKLPSYWGLYLLEVLDPCHRFLTSYYVQWVEEKSSIPFFLWLEVHEVPFNTIQIKFLDKNTLLQNQLKISNGYFTYKVTKKMAHFDSKDKEYIFVITMNQELIVTEGGDDIRHSSLSHGQPVLAAGALKIEHGKLVYIDTESGHYQPSPEFLLQAIKILLDKGGNLDLQHLKVKYYMESKLICTSAAEFLQQYGAYALETVDNNLATELIRTDSVTKKAFKF